MNRKSFLKSFSVMLGTATLAQSQQQPFNPSFVFYNGWNGEATLKILPYEPTRVRLELRVTGPMYGVSTLIGQVSHPPKNGRTELFLNQKDSADHLAVGLGGYVYFTKTGSQNPGHVITVVEYDIA